MVLQHIEINDRTSTSEYVPIWSPSNLPLGTIEGEDSLFRDGSEKVAYGRRDDEVVEACPQHMLDVAGIICEDYPRSQY